MVPFFHYLLLGFRKNVFSTKFDTLYYNTPKKTQTMIYLNISATVFLLHVCKLSDILLYPQTILLYIVVLVRTKSQYQINRVLREVTYLVLILWKYYILNQINFQVEYYTDVTSLDWKQAGLT